MSGPGGGRSNRNPGFETSHANHCGSAGSGGNSRKKNRKGGGARNTRTTNSTSGRQEGDQHAGGGAPGAQGIHSATSGGGSMNRGNRNSGGGGNRYRNTGNNGGRGYRGGTGGGRGWSRDSGVGLGTGAGGNGGGGGGGSEISDEQAIHQFLEMLKEGGDVVPPQARLVQKNFEGDGNMDRYIRQVRYQIRDQVKRNPPPRPEDMGVKGSALGGRVATSVPPPGATRSVGTNSDEWDQNASELAPAGEDGPALAMGGTSVPFGGNEPSTAWGAGSGVAGGVGSEHDVLGYMMNSVLDGGDNLGGQGGTDALSRTIGGGNGNGGGGTSRDSVGPSIDQLAAWSFTPDEIGKTDMASLLSAAGGDGTTSLRSQLEGLSVDSASGSGGGNMDVAQHMLFTQQQRQQQQDLQQLKQQLLQPQHILPPYPQPSTDASVASGGGVGGGSSSATGGVTSGQLHGLSFMDQTANPQQQQQQNLQHPQQQNFGSLAPPSLSAPSGMSDLNKSGGTSLNGWNAMSPPPFSSDPFSADPGASSLTTNNLNMNLGSNSLSTGFPGSGNSSAVVLQQQSGGMQQFGGLSGGGGGGGGPQDASIRMGGMFGPDSSMSAVQGGGVRDGLAQSLEGTTTTQTVEEVWTKYFDEANGRDYWSNGKISVWENPNENKQPQLQQHMPSPQQQQSSSIQQQQQQEFVQQQPQNSAWEQAPQGDDGRQAPWNTTPASEGPHMQQQQQQQQQQQHIHVQDPQFHMNDGGSSAIGRAADGGREGSSAFAVSPATMLGHKSLGSLAIGQHNSVGSSLPLGPDGVGGPGPASDFSVARGMDNNAGGNGRVGGQQPGLPPHVPAWGDGDGVNKTVSHPPGLSPAWSNVASVGADSGQHLGVRQEGQQPQQQQRQQHHQQPSQPQPGQQGGGGQHGLAGTPGSAGGWGKPLQEHQLPPDQGRQQQHQPALDPAGAAARSNLQAGFNSGSKQQQQDYHQRQQQHQHQQQQQQHPYSRHQQRAPEAGMGGDFPNGGSANAAGTAGLSSGAAQALHAKQTQAVAEHMRQAQNQHRGVGNGGHARGGNRGAAPASSQQQHRQQQQQHRQQQGGESSFSDGPGAGSGSWETTDGNAAWPAGVDKRSGGAPTRGARGGAGLAAVGRGVDAKTEEDEAEGKANKAAPRFPPKRTVRNQVGFVYLTHPNGAAGGGPYGPPTVRPSAHLTVRWEIPSAIVEGYGRPLRQTSGEQQPQSLVVGLFRLGVASNTAGIISKNMFDRPPQPSRNPKTTLSGSTPFYAPKSVGTFVFRLYDANDPVDTIATSRVWQVDAQGRDVELSVRFVLSQLKSTDGKGSVMGALAQLAHLLNHLQTAPPQRYNRSVGNALWNAVTSARKQLGGVKIGSGKGGGKDASKDGDDRKLRAVHGAVWCVLNAITRNPAARALLAEAPPQMDPLDGRGVSLPPVDLCMQWQRTFCPFEERYYDTPQALAKHYDDEFGFTPVMAPLESLNVAVLQSLNGQVQSLTPRLLPKAGFTEGRERVRERLEQVLIRQVSQIPRGSTLKVFGSSSNGFGTDNADLDMCIEYADSSRHPEDAGAVIEAIAEKLQGLDVTEVDSRPTARIPIVIFKDGDSRFECDISVMNPLAVRNTRLLKAYSVADPRVRELAYIVKHWAKRRWVNNASEGTLSSYGYLLCLVHFLQTRSPPIVPNLQALPPNWNGEDVPLGFHNNLPVVMTRQPTDGVDYNTYFYDPLVPGKEGERRLDLLRGFGSRNTASSGELLSGFFRYFASELDSRAYVVSVRLGGLADRELKAEASCWSMHTRLSVEDPFETWYDVAHVLKWSRYKHVRMEFARAYALIANASSSSPSGHGKGGRGGAAAAVAVSSDLSELLGKICEQAEPPPFTKTEERSSQEGIEDQAEQLRLELLDAQAH